MFDNVPNIKRKSAWIKWKQHHVLARGRDGWATYKCEFIKHREATIPRIGMVCTVSFLWACFLSIIYKKNIRGKVIKKKFKGHILTGENSEDFLEYQLIEQALIHSSKKIKKEGSPYHFRNCQIIKPLTGKSLNKILQVPTQFYVWVGFRALGKWSRGRQNSHYLRCSQD